MFYVFLLQCIPKPCPHLVDDDRVRVALLLEAHEVTLLDRTSVEVPKRKLINTKATIHRL